MEEKITIAIIEDHPLYISGMEKLLLPYEEFSIVASGGTIEDGKNILHRFQPQIMLLDIDLPDGKGTQLLDYIKLANLQTRVIFVSMYYDHIHIQLAEERGASGYLPKNADPDKLIATLFNVAAGKKSFEKIISTAPVNPISKREKEILELLSEGRDRADISDLLSISNETLKSHIKNILSKTNTSSVTELTTRYLRSKI